MLLLEYRSKQQETWQILKTKRQRDSKGKFLIMRSSCDGTSALTTPHVLTSWIKNNAGSRPKVAGMLTRALPQTREHTASKPSCFRCKKCCQTSLSLSVSKGHVSHCEAAVCLTGFGVLLGCLLSFPCQQIQRKAFYSGISLSDQSPPLTLLRCRCVRGPLRSWTHCCCCCYCYSAV